MFHNLSDFYQSDEWRKLIRSIRIERINDEGQLICEYCGKPIVKSYDCIGHHKIELTEDNVNDYAVSLNPENIMLLHHRCHNYTHDKLGRSMRQVYLVYGAPLSGKSTYIRENMSEGDLLIDMDSIWQCVSGCERYIKPNRLRSVVFRIRDDLIDIVKYRYGKWSNAYVCGGYALSSERDRITKDLGARQIFIDTPREECIARLEADTERDHDEWIKYIDDWFDQFRRTSPPSTEF